MFKRICSKCNKELFYSTKDSWSQANKKNSNCKSCAIKQQYVTDPNKNKGSNNGRTGKTNLEIMIKKYGENGKEKYDLWIKKVASHGFKNGDQNPSFGKIRNNVGRSYKGWYKGLFFRSSLELLFLIEFENKNSRLPLAAEGTFRIKYEEGSRTYCPDFYDPVERKLFEIKAERFLAENTSKFEAGNNFSKLNNMEYVVVTEKSLPYSESGIVWKLHKMENANEIKLTDISLEKLKIR